MLGGHGPPVILAAGNARPTISVAVCRSKKEPNDDGRAKTHEVVTNTLILRPLSTPVFGILLFLHIPVSRPAGRRAA
jgi:hypothetical protein